MEAKRATLFKMPALSDTCGVPAGVVDEGVRVSIAGGTVCVLYDGEDHDPAMERLSLRAREESEDYLQTFGRERDDGSVVGGGEVKVVKDMDRWRFRRRQDDKSVVDLFLPVRANANANANANLSDESDSDDDDDDADDDADAGGKAEEDPLSSAAAGGGGLGLLDDGSGGAGGGGGGIFDDGSGGGGGGGAFGLFDDGSGGGTPLGLFGAELAKKASGQERFALVFDSKYAARLFVESAETARGTSFALFGEDPNTGLADDDEVWLALVMQSTLAQTRKEKRDRARKRRRALAEQAKTASKAAGAGAAAADSSTATLAKEEEPEMIAWMARDGAVDVQDQLGEVLKDGEVDFATIDWFGLLAEAARTGNTEEFVLLFAKNETGLDPKKEMPLNSDGFDQALRWLVRRFALCLPVNEEGATLLHIAAENGSEDIVAWCMAQVKATEKNVSALNATLKNLSMLWTANDGIHIAYALGDATQNWDFFPCELDIIENRSWTPLHYAAHAGQLRTVRQLCEADCDATLLAGESRDTILHLLAVNDWFARKDGEEGALRSSRGTAALDEEAAVGRSAFGQRAPGQEKTAATLAEFFKQFAPTEAEALPSEVVKVVQRCGNFIDERNNDGDTPLQVACREGMTRNVVVLVRNGANTFSTNERGETPLDAARKRGEDTPLVHFLETVEQHFEDFLVAFPPEVGLEIFSHLSPLDLARCASVCRQFRHVAHDNQLWAKYVKDAEYKATDEHGLYYRQYRESLGARTKYQSYGGLDMALFEREVDNDRECDRLFKVVLVGQNGCGKEAYLERFCHDSFTPELFDPQVHQGFVAPGVTPGTAVATAFGAAAAPVPGLAMPAAAGRGRGRGRGRLRGRGGGVAVPFVPGRHWVPPWPGAQPPWQTSPDEDKVEVKTQFLLRAGGAMDTAVLLRLQLHRAVESQATQLDPELFRGAHGIFVMYDIGNAASWAWLQTWFAEFEKAKSAFADVRVVVVGMKADLNQTRGTKLGTVTQFCSKNKLDYCECSAMNGTGVIAAAARLSNAIWSRIEGIEPEKVAPRRGRKKIQVREDRSKCSVM